MIFRIFNLTFVSKLNLKIVFIYKKKIKKIHIYIIVFFILKVNPSFKIEFAIF
jgi:hypothetical protein